MQSLRWAHFCVFSRDSGDATRKDFFLTFRHDVVTAVVAKTLGGSDGADRHSRPRRTTILAVPTSSTAPPHAMASALHASAVGLASPGPNALRRRAATRWTSRSDARRASARVWRAEAIADPAAGVDAETVWKDESECILGTYGRGPTPVFTHGKGCVIWDTEGREYLDFTAGIAVNCLGHSDPDWVAAVTEQAGKLCHVSNLYHTEPGATLARKLTDDCFADRVFYCNSGAEANEGAIKFARKLQMTRARENDANATTWATETVSFSNSFHGRTLGALNLTWKEAYRVPFEPLSPGHTFATYGDLESARAAIVPGKTAAVFVEPVQGEGGVFPADEAFLRGLREICDDAGAVLVFDEVQCGLGRTGYLWGHQSVGVEPDIMTVAKPLAGGLPIGAVLMTQEVADAMKPGDHGSTFAGGPLVCHAANAVYDKVSDPAFMRNVVARGEQLRDGLREALKADARVVEVRGSGLLIGVQLSVPAGPLVGLCRDAGLLVITAGAGDVLRLLPPLIVSEAEVDKAVAIIAEAMGKME
jgi:acetylornithine aminotransferase